VARVVARQGGPTVRHGALWLARRVCCSSWPCCGPSSRACRQPSAGGFSPSGHRRSAPAGEAAWLEPLPADDASWLLILESGGLDWDSAAAAGLTAALGTVERMASEMSAEEQNELVGCCAKGSNDEIAARGSERVKECQAGSGPPGGWRPVTPAAFRWGNGT